MTFAIKPQAQRDLRELLEFIAVDNSNAAHQIREVTVSVEIEISISGAQLEKY